MTYEDIREYNKKQHNIEQRRFIGVINEIIPSLNDYQAFWIKIDFIGIGEKRIIPIHIYKDYKNLKLTDRVKCTFKGPIQTTINKEIMSIFVLWNTMPKKQIIPFDFSLLDI